MDERAIKGILRQLTIELKAASKQVLLTKKLKDNSDVFKSIDVKLNNNVFQIWANDYLKYIDSGRPKNTAQKVPMEALLAFLKRTPLRNSKHANNLIELAYILQKSIQKRGIKARNIFSLMEQVLSDIIVQRLETEFVMAIEEDIMKSL